MQPLQQGLQRNAQVCFAFPLNLKHWVRKCGSRDTCAKASQRLLAKGNTNTVCFNGGSEHFAGSESVLNVVKFMICASLGDAQLLVLEQLCWQQANLTFQNMRVSPHVWKLCRDSRGKPLKLLRCGAVSLQGGWQAPEREDLARTGPPKWKVQLLNVSLGLERRNGTALCIRRVLGKYCYRLNPPEDSADHPEPTLRLACATQIRNLP